MTVCLTLGVIGIIVTPGLSCGGVLGDSMDRKAVVNLDISSKLE